MARRIDNRFREPQLFDAEGRLLARIKKIELEIANLDIAVALGEFLDITEFDGTDPTSYYYGGLDSDLDWKINRYIKASFVMTSAIEATNPTKTSLALAWTDRLTLSYA